MSKRILVVIIFLFICVGGYFVYKLSFGSSNYKWEGHNNEWSAKFGVSRNSAKDMYSGTVNWTGDSDEKERIYINRMETFFDGGKKLTHQK
ncbi:DUF4944 domain-containing protein [Listeria cornellensis]|uniref:Uncharacterized protein n=1 Tax=Listeria cornellensis FSL F6-0969 TaxID=1265820 RepID=W7CI06_9LIST|nr:DUF4944 domain-containing protein [Listeria cornellensis]EUJ32578.1 hypothetical protein PCORN_01310 [Listeria cornellensis FSL F6-0969]